MASGWSAGGMSRCIQQPLYGRGSIGSVGNDVVASTGRPPAPRPAAESASPLNTRDLEVLRHLAAGRSTAQTAAAMSLTTNTVRTRIRRVLGKLAAADRRDAVRLAVETGIV
jgi:DNA-binding NarL/FixJ family response regulator